MATKMITISSQIFSNKDERGGKRNEAAMAHMIAAYKAMMDGEEFFINHPNLESLHFKFISNSFHGLDKIVTHFLPDLPNVNIDGAISYNNFFAPNFM